MFGRYRPVQAMAWTLIAAFAGGGVVSGEGVKPDKVFDTGAAVDVVAWSPDGTQLALEARTWEGDGQAREVTGHLLEVRDARTGGLIKTLFRGRDVRGVLYLPGGKGLSAIVNDPERQRSNMVILIDPTTGRDRLALRGSSEQCWWLAELAASSNGKLVAAVGPRFEENGRTSGGEVNVWDTGTGKLVWQNRDHGDQVDGVAFSPDGKILATGSRDRTVRLWDAATGQGIRTLTGHGVGGVLRVAFSPDSRLLASGGLDGTVRLWDVATGQEKQVLTAGYTKRQYVHVAFSPDGKILATGGLAAERGLGNVTLWDVTTWKPTRTYSEPTGVVLTLAFSPDGKFLAAGVWARRLYLLGVGRSE